jgi:hypothetical protein
MPCSQCFLDRENSVDFSTGAATFVSMPYPYATNGWNTDKGYPSLSNGNTSKGNRKLSDVHSHLTMTSLPHTLLCSNLRPFMTSITIPAWMVLSAHPLVLPTSTVVMVTC